MAKTKEEELKEDGWTGATRISALCTDWRRTEEIGAIL